MNKTDPPRRLLRSVGAIIGGAVASIILSVGTDMALQRAGIFPQLSEPQSFTASLLLLATAYRSIYGVVGSYLTASLAPYRPMGHALVLGSLGLAANVAGAVAMWGVGHHWYPLALIVLAMPTAWMGVRLRLTRLRARAGMDAA